jgi:hypothetical protein
MTRVLKIINKIIYSRPHLGVRIVSSMPPSGNLAEAQSVIARRHSVVVYAKENNVNEMSMLVGCCSNVSCTEGFSL